MSDRSLESFSKAVLVYYIKKRVYHWRINDMLLIEWNLKMDALQAAMDDACQKMDVLDARDPEYWKQQKRFDRTIDKIDKLMKGTP